MFTKPELLALQTQISNSARVLYCLGLRPYVNVLSARSQPLNYKSLLSLLNEGEATSNHYTRGRQINELLRELETVGLISLPNNLDFKQSLNHQTILLPLCHTEQSKFDHLHTERQPMLFGWQPNKALFTELATLMGLKKREYDTQDVGEFVAYWLGRPTATHTRYQWTQKFTQMMKRKYPPVPTTTHIQHPSSEIASVAVDANTRKLVERYPSKK